MKKIISVILCLFFLLNLSSCKAGWNSNRDKAKNRVFYQYFDTVSIFYDYTGATAENFEAVCRDVENMMSKYHKLFDIYNEYEGINNLASINASRNGVKVDKELFDFLIFAKEMYALTDGEVNIAFGSVLSIWHEHRTHGIENPDEATLPSEEILREANLHTSIENLALDEETLTVARLDEKLKLDAGALGKGYACEIIGEYVREKYGEGYVLDFGGNLKAIGAKPDGKGWTTGIQNPDMLSSVAFIRTFEVKNISVVTSGNYQRFYTVGGINYHHIIDKDTLMPRNDYVSVTVIYSSSAVCDALSTAYFNMKTSEIEENVKQFENIEVILVEKSGEIKTIKH